MGNHHDEQGWPQKGLAGFNWHCLCRAEATDVANAVLDGVDGVMLGAETLRGKYPAITVKTVLAICRQAEEVFDYSGHFEWLTLQGELVSVCSIPPFAA